jgi:alpha-beta hydrolase superfamily lysophospholipase
MLVYVHGAGRSGVAAWPNVPRANAIFTDLTGAVTIADKVEALAIASVGRQITVIAHSGGAVPVLLAITEGVVDVSSLVLLEPALYDIARGNPAIERHIAVMSTARAFAAEGISLRTGLSFDH